MEELTREFELVVEGLLAKHVGPINEVVSRNSGLIQMIEAHLDKLNGSVADVAREVARHEIRLAQIDAAGSQHLKDAIRTAMVEHSGSCPLKGDVVVLKTQAVASEAARKASRTWLEWIKPAIYVMCGAAAVLLLSHGPEIVKLLSH
jgi:hypothetical protein